MGFIFSRAVYLPLSKLLTFLKSSFIFLPAAVKYNLTIG